MSISIPLEVSDSLHRLQVPDINHCIAVSHGNEVLTRINPEIACDCPIFHLVVAILGV